MYHHSRDYMRPLGVPPCSTDLSEIDRGDEDGTKASDWIGIKATLALFCVAVLVGSMPYIATQLSKLTHFIK